MKILDFLEFLKRSAEIHLPAEQRFSGGRMARQNTRWKELVRAMHSADPDRLARASPCGKYPRPLTALIGPFCSAKPENREKCGNAPMKCAFARAQNLIQSDEKPHGGAWKSKENHGFPRLFKALAGIPSPRRTALRSATHGVTEHALERAGARREFCRCGQARPRPPMR